MFCEAIYLPMQYPGVPMIRFSQYMHDATYHRHAYNIVKQLQPHAQLIAFDYITDVENNGWPFGYDPLGSFEKGAFTWVRHQKGTVLSKFLGLGHRDD